jgi:hypothetical protein
LPRQFEQALIALRGQLLEWKGKRATGLQELRALLSDKEQLIISQSSELMESFAQLTKQLLAKDARLIQISAEPRYTQAAQKGERLMRLVQAQ